MHLTWRDALATVLVLAAAGLYLLWLAGIEVFGIESAEVVGGVVLVLGFAASATAVVYGVGIGLMRANKVYLVVTSLLGLAALVAGILVLIDGGEGMLATLVASTVVLWAMSTMRHATLPRAEVEDREHPATLPHAA